MILSLSPKKGHTRNSFMVDIWYFGQSCFKVKGKNASLVFDPFNSEFTGLSLPKLEANIVCVTHDHKDHNNVQAVQGIDEAVPFVISGPGEYEILGVNIVGIASFHDDGQGASRGKNVIYQVTIDDINIVHLGDLGQKKLTQDQAEELSCDILLIPVGGGYTIGSKDVPDIIAQLEPKIIIPMHYKIEGLKFDLEPLSKFLSAMGKEQTETQGKLAISKDRLPQEAEILVLAKS